jgi:hypothetical protein
MIIKEWKPEKGRSVSYLSDVGAHAEGQMAHYLKREFSVKMLSRAITM